MKTCTTCGQAKALSEFYVSKGKVRHRCKECEKSWQREYNRRYKAEHGKYPTQRDYQRTCIECGREWISYHADAKYCSNRCQAAYEHGPDRRPKGASRRLSVGEKRRRQASRKLARAAAGTRGKHVLAAGFCARCDAGAVSQPGGRVGVIFYCSARCRRKEWSALRMRGGRMVNRQAIYARDGYRCQIPQCVFRSRKLDMAKSSPHPKSAVLDHIIPLSEWPEGTVPENMRAAHFECNSRRGAHGSDDQLLLIG